MLTADRLCNVIACLVLAVFACSLACAELTVPVLRWRLLSSPTGAAKPAPRKDPVFIYEPKTQKIILFGGRTQDGVPLEDTWTLQVALGDGSALWQLKDKAIRPSARYLAMAGVDVPGSSSRQGVLISMGKGVDGKVLSDTWAYHTTFDVWYQLFPGGEIPDARYGAVGGTAPTDEEDTRLYISHGSDDKSHFQDSYTLKVSGTLSNYNYTTATTIWSRVNTSDSKPSYGTGMAGTVLPGERLILYGGCQGDRGWSKCPSGDGWMISPNQRKLIDGGSWKWVDACPQPRTDSVITYRPDRNEKKQMYRQAIMYGGTYGKQKLGVNGEVAFFDGDAGTWVNIIPQSIDQNFPSPRSGVGLATHQVAESIILFGGENPDGSLLNDLWMLEFNTNVASAGFDNKGLISCFKPTDYRVLHGIMMSIGFCLFLPMSIFIARYLKPHHHRHHHQTQSNLSSLGHSTMKMKRLQCSSLLWYWIHVMTSIIGVLCIVAGFIVAYIMQPLSHFNTTHSYIGVVIISIIGLLLLFTLIQPRHFSSLSDTKLSGSSFQSIIETSNRRTLTQSRSQLTEAHSTVEQAVRQFKQMNRNQQRAHQAAVINGTATSSATTLIIPTESHEKTSHGINGFKYATFWNAMHQYSGLLIIYTAFVNVVLGMLLINAPIIWFILYGVYLSLLLLAFIVLTLLNKPSKRTWSVSIARKLLRKKTQLSTSHQRHTNSDRFTSGMIDRSNTTMTPATHGTENHDHVGDSQSDSDTSNPGPPIDEENEELDREVVVMTIPKRRLQVING